MFSSITTRFASKSTCKCLRQRVCRCVHCKSQQIGLTAIVASQYSSFYPLKINTTKFAKANRDKHVTTKTHYLHQMKYSIAAIFYSIQSSYNKRRKDQLCPLLCPLVCATVAHAQGVGRRRSDCPRQRAITSKCLWGGGRKAK